MTTVPEPLSVEASPTPDPTVSEPPPPRTRSGRVSKPPVRYEPIEKVEDDYASDEYDDDESDVESGIEYSDSELEDEADSEMDDFIVEDKSESDEDDNGSDGESAKPRPRGRPPAKRPTVAPVRKSAPAKK